MTINLEVEVVDGKVKDYDWVYYIDYNINNKIIHCRVSEIITRFYSKDHPIRLSINRPGINFEFLSKEKYQKYVFISKENAEKAVAEFTKQYEDEIRNKEVLLQSLFDTWVKSSGQIQKYSMSKIIKETFDIDIKLPPEPESEPIWRHLNNTNIEK